LGLRAAWRRRYLRAWASAYSSLLLAIQQGEDVDRGGTAEARPPPRRPGSPPWRRPGRPAELHAAAALLAATKDPTLVEDQPDVPAPALAAASWSGSARPPASSTCGELQQAADLARALSAQLATVQNLLSPLGLNSPVVDEDDEWG
jgi:hypothetical protein